jgi:serine/threonine-protein kinase
MADVFDRLKSALSDRYAIERELGRGGMAVVYLARDLKHEREVALKVLRPELAATVGVDRFLREIRIAAQLSHPHILPLHDSGEVDGFLFYVMPFVEGHSLRERLTRERELPISEAVRILRDVVDALSLAHSHEVIHRDIKPDNVMLSGRHALVTDFGVAKALSQAKSSSDLTTAGVALGTPAYMSPEQAVADEQVDHRSDIYAVGALAYELLTGRPPFLGTTPQMVLSAHVADPPDPVTKYRENVSPPLEHLVMRCLEKKPADRWQTADELLAHLEAVVTPSGGMTPTTTRPVATVGVGERKRSVPNTAVILAAAAALVLIGGLWLPSYWTNPSVADADSELPRIVVLPFENLGAPEDEYFADGITDEITTRLAGLSALETIARAAAMRYKDTEKTTAEIAIELNVDYLLAGTVRWSKPAGSEGRVRVSPQLIRGTDHTQVWAKAFDAEVTDVFGLQADVAELVAQALDVSLGGGESEAMRDMPTENIEAYDHYLRGNVVFNEGYPWGPALVDAIEHYETAVQLDPSFALAFAKLSLAISNVGYDTLSASDRVERDARKREAAEEALRLDPDLPEGHAALAAYHYSCCSDFPKAQAELELALARRPNDPFLIYLSAAPYKRGGNLERAAALSARASDLDPGNWSMAGEARRIYGMLRQYDRAERYLERWAATRSSQFQEMPTFLAVYYYYRAELMLKRDGNVDAARELLEQAQEPTGLDYWELVTNLDKPYTRVMCVHEIDACREGLRHATYRDGGVDDVDYYMTMADLYRWVEDEDHSRAYYDSAATAAAGERDAVLSAIGPEHLGRQVIARQFAAYSARIHAGLADTTAALSFVARSLEARSRMVDRFGAIFFEQYSPAAEVYLMVGQYDAALGQLEYLLSIPSYLSVSLLRIDPMWDPLRDDPRFQALLERYAN